MTCMACHGAGGGAILRWFSIALLRILVRGSFNLSHFVFTSPAENWTIFNKKSIKMFFEFFV